MTVARVSCAHGRRMQDGRSARDGREVLVMNELSDYARRMVESDDDVTFLYTRWLDGMIWLAMQEG